jgi:hypothetical protein
MDTGYKAGWAPDLRSDLEDMKRKFMPLPGLKLRPLRHPAHSQSVTIQTLLHSSYILYSIMEAP